MDVATEQRDQEATDRPEEKRRTNREVWHAYLHESADYYARLAEDYRRRAEECINEEGS